MKRILVTGAGGSPAVNFTRSLREAPEDFYLVGTDAEKYCLMRAETDKRYLVPLCNDSNYIPVLNHIIEKENIEFLHAQNDAEVNTLSANRETLKAKVFLPAKETVKICQDKYLSFQKWEEHGLKVAKTILLRNEDDLLRAFEEFGGSLWIRSKHGAGGKGSLPVHDLKKAKQWLDFQKGWDGSFTASELLEPGSTTWMSIWNNGELVVAQGRKRLYWELSRVSPSGITGITGAGITESDPELDEIAQRAVLAIDPKPNGLFGVDLTFDKRNKPNPTEINIGRFFTTHQFFTSLGLNMPYLYVKLAYGEAIPKLSSKFNPVKNDMVWIRGVDFKPVLTSTLEIESNVNVLKDMIQAIRV